MFDVAPTELLLVAVIALVVIGPKDLPRAMRFVGQWVGKARRMAGHFRTGIDAMMREAELEEMEKKWREHNEAIMRAHPQIGVSIIGTVSFLKPILPMVRHHHERWDGKGYPRGLHGEEIPVLARILAIVDAFDAMTNERIYSKPRSPETAAQEILRCAGTQFDPIIARVFVEQVLGF